MPATIYLSTGTPIDVQIYEGQLLPVQPVGDYYQRVGGTGHGSQEVVSEAPDCDIVMHYLTSSRATARSVQIAMAGWQTKYVRVTEPDGTLYTRVLVKQITARVMRGAYARGSTLYTYRVTAQAVMAVQS